MAVTAECEVWANCRPPTGTRLVLGKVSATQGRGLPLVVMMMFRFGYWNDAAVGDVAFNMLELDGGVDHAKVVLKDFLHVAQDTLAD